MRKIKLFGLVSFHLLLSFNSFCQSHTLPQITPKSPNVAAMEKYITVPVNLSTGMIKLDIPLFSFKAGDVTIPISLNYANNGLKTDEIPTWVGLGWSLSCGGVISYQQRGLNDLDVSKGLFPNGKASLDKYFTGTMSTTEKTQYLEDIIQGNIDAEYDFYHYSLPTSNGSFYLTSSTQAKTLPKADVVVNPTSAGFKIRDDQGNDFFFEAQEFISVQNTDVVSPDFYDNSSYYLTKIVAKNGSTVLFRYKSYDFQYTRSNVSIAHMTFLTHPKDDCPSSSVDHATSITKISYLLLDSILFTEGYVKFIRSSNPRKDLKNIDTASKIPSLERVEIYNMNAKKIKSFQLHTSYFATDNRLKLDSLSEMGNSQAIKKWKFEYIGHAWSSFPSIFSTAKDHWGYANANHASTTIPRAPYNTFLANWKTYTVDYADRTSDSSISVLGTLKTIEYPGGGKSEFTYESNQFKLKQYSDFPFAPFMEIPPSAVTIESIANIDVMNGDAKSGNFTIPETGLYTVDNFWESCSDPFYSDPKIVITPSLGYTPVGTHCDDVYHWCHSTDLTLLSAGTYSYNATSTDCVDRDGTKRYLRAYLVISRQVLTAPALKPYQVGGCRISTVKTYSGITADTITKKYIYDDSLQNISFKQYPYYVTSMQYNATVKPSPIICISCGTAYRIHDESTRGIVGPVIEYGKVYELNDQNGVQGKIEHQFMISDNLFGATSEPCVSPINTYWRLGNPIEKNTIMGNTAKTIQTLKNSYLMDAPLSERLNGLRVDYGEYCTLSSGRAYRTNLATIFNEAFHQTGTTEIIKSDTTQLSNSTSYNYTSNNHNEPTEIVKTANNKTLRQKIKYAFDYRNTNKATTAETKAIKNLVGNYINSPIEQIDIVEKNGNQFVTGGTLTIYNENGYVIDKIYQLKINGLIPVSNFTFSTIDSITGALKKDQHYIPSIIFSKYDAKQNIIEQHIDNDKIHSYIWDYNQLYPVAEAVNTGVDDIAYTSFEADGSGGFTGIQSASIITATSSAPTGNKVYQLTTALPISKTVVASKKYIVSYWSNSDAYNVSGTISTTMPTVGKTLGIWKYYEHIVSGVSTISISGTGLIDELRLYPKGSTMATYTYEPLIGISSKCDADNRLLYYEYDDVGRLKIVRDQNKNILNKYDYQNKLMCNAEVSRAFNRNNCGEGYKGSSVTYTIPAGKYCSIDPVQLQQKIDNDVNANAQAYANANGSCIALPKIYNVAISKTFSKIGCSITAEVGSDVVYTVPANKYFSYISQADANAKAEADIDANGQAYANTNGSCGIIYVKLSYENQRADPYTRTADIVLKFYKDVSCTQPYTIKGSLPVKYSLQDIEDESGSVISNTTTSYTITCSGSSIYIGYGIVIYRTIDFGGGTTSNSTYNYSLQENTGYKRGSGSL